MYHTDDGVVYTRWRPPQWRIAILGGRYHLGCDLDLANLPK